MKKRFLLISKIAAIAMIVALLCSTFFAQAAFDGTSENGSGNYTPAKGGYSVPSTDMSDICGFRFSLYSQSSGNAYAKKGNAIDIYLDTNATSRYHSKDKLSKQDIYQNVAGGKLTVGPLVKYRISGKDYYCSDLVGSKITALPDVSTESVNLDEQLTQWHNNSKNINSLYSLWGTNIAPYINDKIFVEPIYKLKIANDNYALTLTECAIFFTEYFGLNNPTTKGPDGTPGYLTWFLANEALNHLYTKENHINIKGTKASTTRQKPITIINYGYGLGVYTMTKDRTDIFPKYTLTYNANCTSTVSDIPDNISNINSGTTVTIDYKFPQRDGYTFKGWSEYSIGAGPRYYPLDALTISENTTLYAQWEKKDSGYLLQFNLNGGTGPNGETTYDPYNHTGQIYPDLYTAVEYDTDKLDSPIKDGCEIMGWRDSSTNSIISSYNSPYMCSGDSILTAQWRYKINYNLNGGEWEDGVYSNTIDASQETTPIAIRKAPQRSGYIFIGWKCDRDNVVYQEGEYYTLAKGCTMAAEWEPITYNIEYDPNYNAASFSDYSSLSKGYDESVAIKEGSDKNNNAFSRVGYTFVGWNTKADGTGTSYAPGTEYAINANLTLYAQWEADTYTVKYNLDGGTGDSSDQTKTYGVDLTLHGVPTKAGHTFIGWKSTEGDSYSASDSYTANKGTTMTAQWIADYTITYVGNKTGAANVPVNQAKPYNIPINLSSQKPTVTGYTFTGWNTKADGTGTDYTPGSEYRANADLTLYAQWEADTYTVKYNLDGGTGDSSDQTKTYGVDLTLHGTPTMGGYIFDGWKSTEGDIYPASGIYKLNQNTTMTAQWLSAKSKYVFYHANTGSTEEDVRVVNMPSTQEFEALSVTINPDKTPTRTGYNFKGWYLDETCTETPVSAGQTLINCDTDVDLYAKWERITYTVKYDLDGGTGDSSDQTKTYGVDLTLHGAPTKAGHTFIGWKSTEGDSYSASGSYTANKGTTMTAQWIADYTVTYVGNKTGAANVPANQAKPYNTPINLSSQKPTITGYTFTGWNTKADGTGTDYVPGAEYKTNADLTLYAQWKINTFVVKYDLDGGTGDSSDQTKTYGVDLTLHGAPTKAGHTFIGWRSTEGDNYSASGLYTANKGTTMTAQWIADYTVTYVGNKTGVSNVPANQAKPYNTSINLSSQKPAVTGYTFTGWNTKADGTGTAYASGAEYNANADLTLYAQWKINTFVVKYDLDGGTGDSSDQIKTYGVALTLHGAPTKAGHTFIGWRSTEGDTYSASGSYTANKGTTMTAQWIADYTVTYVGNKTGVSNVPANQAKPYNTSINLSSQKPAVTGYTFTGWNTKADGTGTAYASGAEYNANADLTLYAQWKINTFVVKYDLDGGAGDSSDQIKTYGVALTLHGAPTKAGHTFIGWRSTEGDTYFASGSYTANKGTTMTAQWIADYTVTYVGNKTGAANVPANQAKPYNTPINLSSQKPTVTGYTFTGWNTKADGTGTAYTSGAEYKINADLTLYAQWTPNQYKIRFDSNGGNGSMEDMSMIYDVSKNLTPNAFSKVNSHFIEWNTKADGSGTSYKDKQSVINLTATNGTTVTLYAMWLEAEKQSTVPEIGCKPGDTITYTITIVSPKDVDTLTITDKIPNETQYVNGSASDNAVYEDDILVWTIRNAKAGIVYTVNFKVTADTNLVAGTEIKNTASVKIDNNNYDYNTNTTTDIIAEYFIITYNANGGNGEIPTDSKLYSSREEVTVLDKNTLSRDGYQFAGWNTKADGSGTHFAPEDTFNITADTTLYAMWLKLQKASIIEENTLKPNDIIGYNITFVSPEDISSVILTDTVPVNTIYNNDANHNGTYVDGKVEWKLNDVKANTEYVFSFSVTVAADAKQDDKIINTASAIVREQEYKTNVVTDVIGEFFNVYYHANGGEGECPTDIINYARDTQVTVKDNGELQKPGYYFTGWNTSEDGSGTHYEPETVFNISANTDFYAMWLKAEKASEINTDICKPGTVISYTITVVAPEDSQIMTITDTVPENTIYNNDANSNGVYSENGIMWTVSNAKAHDEYTFTFSVTVGEVSIGTVIKNNALVNWQDKQYDTNTSADVVGDYYLVFYNANGGQGDVPTDDTFYLANDEVTVKAADTLSKNGYYFIGWNTKADGGGKHYDAADAFSITENTTLYAMWLKVQKASLVIGGNCKPGEKIDYTITVVSSENCDKITVTDTVPNNTTYADNASANGTYENNKIVWTIENVVAGKEYALTFSVVIDQNAKSGDKISNFATVNIGEKSYNTNTTNDVVADFYTITYDANGGSGDVPIDNTLYSANESGTVKGSEKLVRENYEFIEWNTEPDGSGTSYKENDKINIHEDVTLYAQWKKCTITVSYKIVSKEQPADARVPGVDTVDKGSAYTAQSTKSSNTNFVFDGWYTDEKCTEKFTDGTKLTESITLYGKWTEVKKPVNEDPPFTGDSNYILITSSTMLALGIAGVSVVVASKKKKKSVK